MNYNWKEFIFDIEMKKTISILLILFCFIDVFSQETNVFVKDIWKNNIHKYVQPISSLSSDDYSDLQFLKPLLKDKSYVFLGESSHEVEEYFQIRSRLVQFLNKELDYKVIAFENYKAVTLDANSIKNEISVDSLFTYYFSYMGNRKMKIPQGAKELSQYFQNNEIITTAFDIDLERPSRFQQIIKKHFPNCPDSVLFQDSIITSRYSKKEGLAFKYWEDIIQDSSVFDQKNLISQEYFDALVNRVNWLYHLPSNTPHKRDSVMGRNIMRLINDFYPNEKIIFLAHNWHISKYNPDNEVMNEYLPDSIISKSYILGLYAYQGSTGVRDSGPVELVKNKRNSLGAIMNSAGYKVAFCDFSKQKYTPENSWMFKEIKTISWAVQRPIIIPKKRYDGIIQIKDIRATKNKE